MTSGDSEPTKLDLSAATSPVSPGGPAVRCCGGCFSTHPGNHKHPCLLIVTIFGTLRRLCAKYLGGFASHAICHLHSHACTTAFLKLVLRLTLKQPAEARDSANHGRPALPYCRHARAADTTRGYSTIAGRTLKFDDCAVHDITEHPKTATSCPEPQHATSLHGASRASESNRSAAAAAHRYTGRL